MVKNTLTLTLTIVMVAMLVFATANAGVTVTATPWTIEAANLEFSGATYTAGAYTLPAVGLQSTREVIRAEIGSNAAEVLQLIRADFKLLKSVGYVPQNIDFESYRNLFAPMLAEIATAEGVSITTGALEAKAAAADAMRLAKSVYGDLNFEQAVPLFVTYDASAANPSERFTVYSVTADRKLAEGPKGALIVPMKWGEEKFYNLLFLRGTSRQNDVGTNVVFGVRNLTRSSASGSFFAGPVIELDGKSGQFFVATALTPPTKNKSSLKVVLTGELFKLPSKAADLLLTDINDAN